MQGKKTGRKLRTQGKQRNFILIGVWQPSLSVGTLNLVSNFKSIFVGIDPA